MTFCVVVLPHYFQHFVNHLFGVSIPYQVFAIGHSVYSWFWTFTGNHLIIAHLQPIVCFFYNTYFWERSEVYHCWKFAFPLSLNVLGSTFSWAVEVRLRVSRCAVYFVCNNVDHLAQQSRFFYVSATVRSCNMLPNVLKSTFLGLFQLCGCVDEACIFAYVYM